MADIHTVEIAESDYQHTCFKFTFTVCQTDELRNRTISPSVYIRDPVYTDLEWGFWLTYEQPDQDEVDTEPIATTANGSYTVLSIAMCNRSKDAYIKTEPLYQLADGPDIEQDPGNKIDICYNKVAIIRPEKRGVISFITLKDMLKPAYYTIWYPRDFMYIPVVDVRKYRQIDTLTTQNAELSTRVKECEGDIAELREVVNTFMLMQTSTNFLETQNSK